MTHVSNPSIDAALGTARVRAWRMGLVSVHKALIDAERQRYERLHGRIPTPHDALRLVIHDPWFDWLRPLAELIVRLDERLADQTRLERAEVRTIAVEIHVLLRAGRPSRFGHEYPAHVAGSAGRGRGPWAAAGADRAVRRSAGADAFQSGPDRPLTDRPAPVPFRLPPSCARP